jgi:hypothetical protein
MTRDLIKPKILLAVGLLSACTTPIASQQDNAMTKDEEKRQVAYFKTCSDQDNDAGNCHEKFIWGWVDGAGIVLNSYSNFEPFEWAYPRYKTQALKNEFENLSNDVETGKRPEYIGRRSICDCVGKWSFDENKNNAVFEISSMKLYLE